MREVVKTYDIDSHNTAVEVNDQSLEAQSDSQTLRFTTESILAQCGWDCVSDEDSSRWVEVWGDVVGKDLLDQFLGRFLVTLWDLLKCLVCWCEDGIVGCCAIQCLDQIGILIDELSKLRGVLAAGDELVDGLVWLVMWVAWVVSVTRLLVRFLVVASKDVDVFDSINSRIEPSLHIEFHHRGVAFEGRLSCLACVGGSVNCIVQSILGECYCILELLLDAGPDVVDIALNSVEECLCLLLRFDDQLFGHLLVRNNKGRGNGRERQKYSDQLHFDDCEVIDEVQSKGKGNSRTKYGRQE
jgi:hypothetical protein